MTDVVDQAARVSEIGFADFTAQLVRDVFGVLLQTNLEQTKVYMDLVERISTGVATFIERTKDDVAPEEISAFLAAVSDTLKVEANQSLDQGSADRLNAAITVPASAGVGNNAVAKTGTLDAAGVTALRKAVATRIAFGRFQLLEAMVKQGITRIVIDSGVIESKLTFNTYTRSTSTNRDSSFNTAGAGAAVGFGGILPGKAGGFGAGAFGLTVNSASNSSRDVSGSSVNIFGRVEIRFKTDYVPLV